VHEAPSKDACRVPKHALLAHESIGPGGPGLVGRLVGDPLVEWRQRLQAPEPLVGEPRNLQQDDHRIDPAKQEREGEEREEVEH